MARKLPEVRLAKIRRWDDVYATILHDIEKGIIPTKGKGGVETFTKKEVDAMFADVGKTIEDLRETLAALEKKIAKNNKDGG